VVLLVWAQVLAVAAELMRAVQAGALVQAGA
jgi:hypothetical protein